MTALEYRVACLLADLEEPDHNTANRIVDVVKSERRQAMEEALAAVCRWVKNVHGDPALGDRIYALLDDVMAGKL